MGAMNRAARRKAEREQVRNWRKQGEEKQVLALIKNGITQKDLDKAHEDGYRDGYLYATEGFLKKMYAAIAKELLEHQENSRDEIVQFVKAVDHRFSLMFDADDEIDSVYNELGVWFNIDRNALNRIEEE